MDSELSAVAEVIGAARRIAVITHIRPDCDTLGSAMGLRAALEAMHRETVVCCEDAIPEKFGFLPGIESVTAEPEGAFDLVVSVDCSDSMRMGSAGALFRAAKNTVNLDHHRSNLREGRLNVVRENYSSCSELITELVEALGIPLTREIALPLYLGICSDTGCFSHSNVNEHSFLTAAKLLPYAGDVTPYTYRMFKDNPKARFRLLGNTLKAARFYADDRICLLTVRLTDLVECGAESSATEGFVDYAVNCSPVAVGASILESKPNQFKVSLRGKGNVDVCAIAERFGGGGHTKAAGCMICGYYEDVAEKLVRAIEIELEISGA